MKKLAAAFLLASSLQAEAQAIAPFPKALVQNVWVQTVEHPQLKGVGHNPANIYLAHLRIRHVQP